MSAAAPVDAGSSRPEARRAPVVVDGGGLSLDAGAPALPDRSPSVVARPLLLAVRGYQLARAGRPSPCRFHPSCSAYAVDALRLHGAARGSYLAVRRLARCHPWGGQGYDPVPEKKAH